MTHRAPLVLAVVLSGMCVLLQAQDGGVPTLNLDEAIRNAQQNNPEVISLQRQEAVARAEVAIARQLDNPNFLFETSRSTPNYFVGAGYLFELGGKRANRIQIAAMEASIAELNLQAGLLTLRHDIRVAFYTGLQAGERFQQLDQTRDLSSRLLNIAQQRFELGDVARLEVLQAEVELKRAENDAKQAEYDRQSQLIRLNALLNRDLRSPVELNGSLQDLPSDVTLDALVEQALSRNTDLLKLQQEQKAEEARLALARSQRTPDLDLQAGAEIHDPDHEYGWKAALAVGLPIFNRGQADIDRSLAMLEALKAQQEATRRKIRADVAEAFSRYQSARFRIENFQTEILPLVTEMEKLAEESYREGKTGILSVIDAQRNARQTRLDYLDALLDFQTAVADLEVAAGVELPLKNVMP